MKKFLLALTALSVALMCGCSHIEEYEEDIETTEDEVEIQTVTVSDKDYYSRFKGQDISINVYNWGEYIPDGSEEGILNVNEEFTKLTGIKVNYSTYATNEELYAKLKGGASTYDIIIPSDYMISRMIKENMLEPIDMSEIPNFSNIMEKFRDPEYDPDSKYSVPYTWGTVGIIYDKTVVDEEDIGWDILWDEDYAGSILMFDNPRDAFAIAENLLGYSLNTEDSEELRKAAEKLKEQKKVIQAYVADEVFDKMIGGEAAMAPYYNGDAVTMIADNPDLAFSIPVEGSNLFTDCLCIPKESQKRELAEMYINFMLEPEVGLANTEAIGYSTPNTKVYELLDEETKSDPTAYPDEESLAHCGYYTYIGPELSLYIDSKWAEVLTADEKYSAMIMPMFLGACVAGIIALNIVRATRRKREE